MTDERMALAELLEKGSDSDLLREKIGYAAQRLMQLDVGWPVGVGHVRARGGYREMLTKVASEPCYERWGSYCGTIGASWASFNGRGSRRKARRTTDCFRLRAQPVDATPFILTDGGLKPKAFLWRDLGTIRGCASTSENGQGTALLAISTDLTSTCCCAC